MFLNKKKKKKTEKEKEEREGERRQPEWQILNQAYNNRKLIDITAKNINTLSPLGWYGVLYSVATAQIWKIMVFISSSAQFNKPFLSPGSHHFYIRACHSKPLCVQTSTGDITFLSSLRGEEALL